MKFRVTMKSPDCLYESVDEAVKESLPDGMPEDEAEMLCEVRCEKIRKLCGRWFKYGEYLTVEVDTDAMTCTVVPES